MYLKEGDLKSVLWMHVVISVMGFSAVGRLLRRGRRFYSRVETKWGLRSGRPPRPLGKSNGALHSLIGGGDPHVACRF